VIAPNENKRQQIAQGMFVFAEDRNERLIKEN